MHKIALILMLLFAPVAFGYHLSNGPDNGAKGGGGVGGGNADTLGDGSLVQCTGDKVALGIQDNGDANCSADLLTAAQVENQAYTATTGSEWTDFFGSIPVTLRAALDALAHMASTVISSFTVVRVNVPVDTDGNGTYDTVRVSGNYTDFAADGVMDGVPDAVTDLNDIVEAIADLDDTKKHILIEPGTYVYPATDPVLTADTGYIVLATSNTLFECVGGWGSTVLQGLPPGASYDKSYSVIHITASSNVEVRGCDFDGGAPTVAWDASTVQPGSATIVNYVRRGIRTSSTPQHTDIRYVGNRVRNFTSVAMLMEGANDCLIQDNEIDNIAGYWESGAVMNTNYGYYVYTNVAGVTSNNCRVINNKASHVDGSGLIVNAEPAVATPIVGTVLIGNQVRNSGGCLWFRGTINTKVYDTTCDFVGSGIAMTPSATDWQPVSYIGNKDLTIDGIVTTNVTTGSPAFYITRNQENVTIRNFTVRGTLAQGIQVVLPQRGLIIENGVLRNIASLGIEETIGGGAVPTAVHDQRRTYRNIVLDGSVTGGLTNSRYLGNFTEAVLATMTCNKERDFSWAINTEAADATDATFGSGTPAVTSRVRCESGTWVTYPAPSTTGTANSNHGFTILGGLVTMENIKGRNVGGSGIAFTDPTTAYTDLKVSGADLDGLFWGYQGETASGVTLTTSSTPSQYACNAYTSGYWVVLTEANGANCTTGGAGTKVFCKCMVVGTAWTWIANTGSGGYRLADGTVGAIEFTNMPAATNGITIQDSVVSNWIGNPGINFIAGTATGVSIQDFTATSNRAPNGLGAVISANVTMTSAVINTAATLTKASASVQCTNTLTTKPCANGIPNRTFVEIGAAPDAEGCDAASEKGSFALRTDGATTGAETAYWCIDGANWTTFDLIP